MTDVLSGNILWFIVELIWKIDGRLKKDRVSL